MPEWIVVPFVVAKIGAVLVPANTALRASDMQYLLSNSEAGTVITISGCRGLDYLGTLEEIGATSGRFSTLRRLVYIGRGEAPRFLPYERLRDLADAAEEGLHGGLGDERRPRVHGGSDAERRSRWITSSRR